AKWAASPTRRCAPIFSCTRAAADAQYDKRITARLRHASRTKDPSLPHSIARETAAPLLRRTPVAWPRWVEAGLVVAAIGALLPWFDRVAVDELGRDRRFADAAIAVGGLPDPVLPSLCPAYGDVAEPIVRERLCRAIDGRSPVGGGDRLPLPLIRSEEHTSELQSRSDLVCRL